MKDHMLSHSGNLPTCQIGTSKNINQGKGRSFKFGKNLKGHIKIKHIEVYHYNCEKCDYSTDSKGYYKTHVKHHGEQPKNTFVMTVAKPLMANLF